MSGEGGRTRILLVDDHELFREALAELLGRLPDMQVVGSAGDISGAIEFLETQRADVILLDYDLGRELAFELFQRLPGIASQATILILSAGVNTSSVRRLLACGAAGIVWKHAGVGELARTIRRTMAESSSTRGIVSDGDAQRHRTALFTQRQLFVTRAVLQGQATKEIAGALDVSVSSVKCTIQQIFQKTGTRSRSELVRVLLERYPDNVLVEAGRQGQRRAVETIVPARSTNTRAAAAFA
jgi:two-component system nitrate/nitrite response regulator NarL